MSQFRQSRPIVRRTSIAVDDAFDAAIANLEHLMHESSPHWLLNVLIREAVYAMEAFAEENGGPPTCCTKWRLVVQEHDDGFRFKAAEREFAELDKLLNPELIDRE